MLTSTFLTMGLDCNKQETLQREKCDVAEGWWEKERRAINYQAIQCKIHLRWRDVCLRPSLLHHWYEETGTSMVVCLMSFRHPLKMSW